MKSGINTATSYSPKTYFVAILLSQVILRAKSFIFCKFTPCRTGNNHNCFKPVIRAVFPSSKKTKVVDGNDVNLTY